MGGREGCEYRKLQKTSPCPLGEKDHLPTGQVECEPLSEMAPVAAHSVPTRLIFGHVAACVIWRPDSPSQPRGEVKDARGGEGQLALSLVGLTSPDLITDVSCSHLPLERVVQN